MKGQRESSFGRTILYRMFGGGSLGEWKEKKKQLVRLLITFTSTLSHNGKLNHAIALE